MWNLPNCELTHRTMMYIVHLYNITLTFRTQNGNLLLSLSNEESSAMCGDANEF